MRKMNENSETVGITLVKEAYLSFSKYAKERGFSVRKATELALNYSVVHDLASEWLKDFLVDSLPAAPSRKRHSLADDILKLDIKELTE